MSLTKNQREVIKFVEKGFENVTGIKSPHSYYIHGSGKYNKYGNADIGAGRTIWYWEREIIESRQFSISISRYMREGAGGGIAKGLPEPTGRMRALNFEFSDVCKFKYDPPVIHGHIDLNMNLDSLIGCLGFARDLTAEFKTILKLSKTGAEVVSEIASRHKPKEVSRYRTINERATFVGVLPGMYSGIYFTVSKGMMSGLERQMARHLADATNKTLAQLLKAT